MKDDLEIALDEMKKRVNENPLLYMIGLNNSVVKERTKGFYGGVLMGFLMGGLSIFLLMRG